MKFSNIIKYMGVAGISAMMFTSCSDFLDEKPTGSISEEQIFSDPEYAESNLLSCYRQWRECFKDRYLWEVMVGTDEIQSGALQALKEDGGRRGSLDRYDAMLTSELSYIKDTWDCRYLKVGESAKLINALKSKKDEDELSGKIYGEANFIRAGLCMELTQIFGRIPIIDMERQEELTYARQPLNVVWGFIIDDLKEAVRYCPESNDPQRATVYAANMLLGYAYMAAPEETGLRDFEEAAKCFKAIIDSQKFRLVEYYDLFDYNVKNSAEAIFEWQFNTTWPDNNCIQFQIGSRAAANMGQDGCFFAGYDHAVPSAWAYSDVEDGGIWEDGDIRRDESLRYDFEWFGQVPDLSSLAWEGLGDDHDELLPHIKKYEDFRTDIHSGMGVNNMWNSGKNIPWLRYANVLLLYAECLNETGHTSEAVDYVNEVRKRAWENNIPADKQWNKGMSKDQFFEALMTERVRELFGERWRRFDLVRTGKFLEYVKARNKWANHMVTNSHQRIAGRADVLAHGIEQFRIFLWEYHLDGLVSRKGFPIGRMHSAFEC